MSTTVVAAIGACWLVALTAALMAAVRQLSIVSLRLDRQLYGGQAPVDDGIAIRSRIAPEVADLLPDIHSDRPAFLLVLGGTCTACQDMLREMHDDLFASPVVALLSGRKENIDILADLTPAGFTVVRDPEARHAVRSLEVSTTPFAFEVRDGRVAAKAAIRGADHLRRYIKEAESVSTSELLEGLNSTEGEPEHASH